MIRTAVILFAFAVASACASGGVAPKVSLYGFTENNYPCVDLEFPDQIRYDGMKASENKNELVLRYDISIPNYKVEVYKLYAKNGGWSTETLPSLKEGAAKVYEISDMDNTPEKSAVITLEEIDGVIYLKGSIAEFMQKDRAIRIDVYRAVKQVAVFRKNTVDAWKNSTTGVRSIENMKTIVDYVYNKMKVTECQYKESIDKDFK